MLFATLDTRTVRLRTSSEGAESDCRKDQDAGRGRLRLGRAAGTLCGSSNLDGWNAVAPVASISREGGHTAGHEPVEVSTLLDAAQQIVALRALLRDKQAEVDVLAEALNYARDLCLEN